MEELELERVLFVPGGIPPHKEASSIVAVTEDRVALVEAAIAGNERFVLDLTEVEAGRKMYSHETVSLLKAVHEADEWYFISGADEVSNLLAWKEPDRLLSEAYMVAATRPGHDLSQLDHLAKELENFASIVPVQCSRVDISATDIRERLRTGKTARYLVPEAVHEVIRERGLYREKDKHGASESKQPTRGDSLRREMS